MVRRGKIPSLISGSNGKPQRVVAIRKRTCVRCLEEISKAQECFEIPQLSGGFSNKRPHCKSCFLEILDQTQNDLNKLKIIKGVGDK